MHFGLIYGCMKNVLPEDYVQFWAETKGEAEECEISLRGPAAGTDENAYDTARDGRKPAYFPASHPGLRKPWLGRILREKQEQSSPVR